MDFSNGLVFEVPSYHDFGGFSTEGDSSFERSLEEPDWDQFDFDWGPLDDNLELKAYQGTIQQEAIASTSTSTLESYELYQNLSPFPAEFDTELGFIDPGITIDFSSVADFDPFQDMAPPGADSHSTSVSPLDLVQTSRGTQQSNYNSPYSTFSSTSSNMDSNNRYTPATSLPSAEASPSKSLGSYVCKTCPRTFLKQHELK